jgi:N-acetyl-gamma-glutamyl-phosphate reductase
MTNLSQEVASVAVVGATGYSGGELSAILARHPYARIAAVFSGAKSGTTPFRSLHPSLSRATGPDAVPFELDLLLAAKPDVVFLATPNEIAVEVAPQLLDRGIRVIDLSGAFRLRDGASYPTWYGFQHPHAELLREAVYGLTEYCNGELSTARLVANPGCYPTSVLLAVRPLVALIDRDQPLICDSMSGISGAGKKSDLAYSFAEVFGNFKAYGVAGHRHEPEIRQGLKLGDRATLIFVPHLLPTVRGILSTIHVAFKEPLTAEHAMALYAKAYAASPLVTVLPHGELPELKNVINTPRAEIGFQLLQGGRRAVLVSVIDNLLKGAASQAIQNFNRMFGYADTEGLS